MDNKIKPPSPTEIRTARVAAGLTQTQAATLVMASMRGWQDWEHGKRSMPPGLWYLFRLLTGQASLPTTVSPHPRKQPPSPASSA